SYRGAWAAFGIEFNFPVSHNWVSLSPVDFAFRQNPDGSGSVLVGNVDRVYGMQWSVEVVLRPHSTVLEEKVRLNNRSDVRHRFYWWNNAGIQAWDDSHIEYPMRFAASHGFKDVQPWPVEADGTDLSVIKNQTKGPVSLFVHGSREPFMGVWHPHTNVGTVHFADYAQLPAKKIWSWGTDPDGLDWRKTLSDNDSAYVEVQAGLFRNQETYAFLEPRQSISFSEFWMPVRDIGGISRANLAGVVHLSRRGNALLAGLNANRAVSGATLRILLADREVYQEKSDVTPEKTWNHELANADPQQKYTFELRDANNTILLRQTEGEYDWTPLDQIHVGPQASYRIPDPEHRTEDDWLQLGNEQELDGDILTALQTYQDGIKKFHDSFGLSKAAGRLCAGLLRFSEAKDYLEPVYERDTSDSEISYYLGIAYDGLGQNRQARDSYEAATRMPDFRAAGALRLAELSAREGNFKQAQSYLQLASQTAPDDPRTAEELSATMRAVGEKENSEKLAQEFLARFPQSYFLKEQVGKPDLQHLADDAERVLNVAAEYMRLGLYAQALDVLSRSYPASVPDQSEPGQLPPNRHPLVAYYRGYCREKLGQPGADEFKTAAKLSASYVFPSRAEDLQVLSAALKSSPEDASAHYLLGTLYFSKGIADRALNEWEQARKMNPRIPVLHASLGRALLYVKRNPEQALNVFEEGLQADPGNVDLYTGMDQALSILQRPPQERVAALEHYPDQPHMPTALVYELILNLTEAGEFDKASALFHNRFFQRAEGGTNVRQVWLEVQTQHALSLAQRGQCEAATKLNDEMADAVPDLPFTKDGLEPFLRTARSQYLRAEVYKACKLPDKAREHFEHAAAQTAVPDSVWAWKASSQLVGSKQNSRSATLQSSLDHLRNSTDARSPGGWWYYNSGLLDQALGNDANAQRELQQVFMQPDQSMLYHLARLAISGRNP
ncbi:MAG TPA: DUF5107 domain-containing protein, partial [Candidatus Sulfotelmatobacter sp.]|nr:DUF5107 domain-containing protein [Candidatus Sulfotelmatobacter sp.]